MVRLWELMTELYGHKWTQVHGLGDESGNWGKMFTGIDRHQLARGVRAWTAQGGDLAKWPPGAVELRELCIAGGPELGIPSVDRAWREACDASTDPTTWKFSHPIVHEAGRLTDWYSIKTGTPKAETVQRRFEKRYADLTGKLQRGEQLVNQQHLLGSDLSNGAVAVAEALAERNLNELMRRQGVKKTTPENALQELRAKLGIKRDEA